MTMPGLNRSARNTAMDLLSRREHCVRELTIKLQQRDFDAEEIESALQKLQSENLLNDERYAESYIHQRIQKGFGPLRIQQELTQRGVDDGTIRLQLDYPNEFWDKLMQQQRNKRFGPNIPDDYNEKMKQARFLQNRGFSTESVMRLFR